MAAKRIQIQSLDIEDAPGSLQKLLAQIADADIDLECMTAFSTGQGKGQICLNSRDAQALANFAQGAGLSLSEAAGFIIDGNDKVGAAAEALKGLADAGINGVAAAALACAGQYHMIVIVAAADGDAAQAALGA